MPTRPKPLQIRSAAFAPDDALDPFRAEAGRFCLLQDVAHLAAQAAGELTLLIGGAARRVVAVARAVAAVVAVTAMAAPFPRLFGVAVTHFGAVERAIPVCVAVAAACGMAAVMVFAAPFQFLFRTTAAHFGAVERAIPVFVAMAAACPVAAVAAVVFVAVFAAPFSVLLRMAVAATHAAGRSSVAASLMNDNRYLGQFSLLFDGRHQGRPNDATWYARTLSGFTAFSLALVGIEYILNYTQYIFNPSEALLISRSCSLPATVCRPTPTRRALYARPRRPNCNFQRNLRPLR